MDIKSMKMVIGLVVAIVAQAFGMIWYIAQLDSTVTNNTTALENIKQYDDTELWEVLDALTERLVGLERIDSVMENEMRTIMSDHSNFGDVLKDMGKSGYGDNRQYGNYGGQ
jgi:hypothetical protein|tara:strand:- start:15975 stop:16310 length:336 start_codon:yes stop_codon:yes gene_type:complete